LIAAPSLVDYGGFAVIQGIVHQSGLGGEICAGLVGAIKLIDIFDELTVQKIQWDVLRANA
jgi:hypothetical protein